MTQKDQNQKARELAQALGDLKESTLATELVKEMQGMAKKWNQANPHRHSWDDPFAEAIAKVMEVLAS